MLTQHLFYIGEDSDVTSNDNRNDDHVNAMVDVNFQNRFSSLPRLKEPRHVFYNDLSEENNNIKRGRRTYGGRDVRHSYNYNDNNDKNENQTLESKQRLKVDPSCLFFGTDTKKTDLAESFTNVHKSIGLNASSKDSITTSISGKDSITRTLSSIETTKTDLTVKHSTSDSQKYVGLNSSEDNLPAVSNTAKGDILDREELVLETESIPLQTKNIENVNQNSQSQLNVEKSHAECFGNVMIQNEDTMNVNSTFSVNNILTVDSHPVKMAGGTDIIEHNTCSNIPSADQHKNDNNINSVNFNGINDVSPVTSCGNVSQLTFCGNKHESIHTKDRVITTKRMDESKMEGDTSLLTISKGNMSFYCPSKQINSTSVYDKRNNSDDAKKVCLKPACDETFCGEVIGQEKHVKEVTDCDQILVENDIISGQEISVTRDDLEGTLKGTIEKRLNAGLIDGNNSVENNFGEFFTNDILAGDLFVENSGSNGFNGDNLKFGLLDPCVDDIDNISIKPQVDSVPASVLSTEQNSGNTKSDTNCSLNSALFAQSNLSTRQYANNHEAVKNDKLFNDDANSVLKNDRNAINEVFNNLTSGSYGFLSKANELIEKLELPSQGGSTEVLLDENSNIVSDDLSKANELIEKLELPSQGGSSEVFLDENSNIVNDDPGLSLNESKNTVNLANKVSDDVTVNQSTGLSLNESKNTVNLANKVSDDVTINQSTSLFLNESKNTVNLANKVSDDVTANQSTGLSLNESKNTVNLTNKDSDDVTTNQSTGLSLNKSQNISELIKTKNQLDSTLNDILQNGISQNDIGVNRLTLNASQNITELTKKENEIDSSLEENLQDSNLQNVNLQNDYILPTNIPNIETGKQEIEKIQNDDISTLQKEIPNILQTDVNPDSNPDVDKQRADISQNGHVERSTIIECKTGKQKYHIELELTKSIKDEEDLTIDENNSSGDEKDDLLSKPCAIQNTELLNDIQDIIVQDEVLISEQDELSTVNINDTCKEQTDLFQESVQSEPCSVQSQFEEEGIIIVQDKDLINKQDEITIINTTCIEQANLFQERDTSKPCPVQKYKSDEKDIQTEHKSELENTQKDILRSTKLTINSNLEINNLDTNLETDCLQNFISTTINNQVKTDVPCNDTNVSLSTSNLLNDKNNKLQNTTSDALNSQLNLDSEVCQTVCNSRQEFNKYIERDIPGTLVDSFNTTSNTTCDTKNDEEENENNGGLNEDVKTNGDLLVDEKKYIEKDIPETLFDGFATTCSNTKNDKDENEEEDEKFVGVYEDGRTNSNFLIDKNEWEGFIAKMAEVEISKDETIEVLAVHFQAEDEDDNLTDTTSESENYLDENNKEMTKVTCKETNSINKELKTDIIIKSEKGQLKNHLQKEETCNDALKEKKNDDTINTNIEITNNSRNTLKKLEEEESQELSIQSNCSLDTGKEIAKQDLSTLDNGKEIEKQDPSVQLNYSLDTGKEIESQDPSVQLNGNLATVKEIGKQDLSIQSNGNLDTGLMFGKLNKGEDLLLGKTDSDCKINIHDETPNQEIDVIDCELELTNNEIISYNTVGKVDHMDLNVGCKEESIVNGKAAIETDETVEEQCEVGLILKNKSDEEHCDGKLINGSENNSGLDTSCKQENLVSCNQKTDIKVDAGSEGTGSINAGSKDEVKIRKNDLSLKKQFDEKCRHDNLSTESNDIDAKIADDAKIVDDEVDRHSDMDKNIFNGLKNGNPLNGEDTLSPCVQNGGNNDFHDMKPIDEPCSIELVSNQEQEPDADEVYDIKLIDEPCTIKPIPNQEQAPDAAADASGSDSESLGSGFDIQDHIDKSKSKRSERESRIRSAFSFVLGLLSDSDDEIDVPVHDKLNKYTRHATPDGKKRNGSFKEDLLRGSIKFLSSDSSVDEDDVIIPVNGKPSKDDVDSIIPVNEQTSLSKNGPAVPEKGQLLQDNVDLAISVNGPSIKNEEVAPILKDCQILQDNNLLQSMDEIIAFSSPISSPFVLEKNESNFNLTDDSINLQLKDSTSSTITDNIMTNKEDHESTIVSDQEGIERNNTEVPTDEITLTGNVKIELTNGTLLDEVDLGAKVKPYSSNINEELDTIDTNPDLDLVPTGNVSTEEQITISNTPNLSLTELESKLDKEPIQIDIGPVLDNHTPVLEANFLLGSGSVSNEKEIQEENFKVDSKNTKDGLLLENVIPDTTLNSVLKVEPLLIDIEPKNELLPINTVNIPSVPNEETLLVPVTISPGKTREKDFIIEEQNITSNTVSDRNIEILENGQNKKEEPYDMIPTEELFEKTNITLFEPDYDYDYYEPSSADEIDSSAQMKELNISFQKKIDSNVDIVDNDKVIIEIISLLIDQVDEIFKSVNNEKIASRNSSFSEKGLVSEDVLPNEEDLSCPEIGFDTPDNYNVIGLIPDDEKVSTKSDSFSVTYADICKGKSKMDICAEQDGHEKMNDDINKESVIIDLIIDKESVITDDHKEQLIKIDNDKGLNLGEELQDNTCSNTIDTNINELKNTTTQECGEKEQVQENIIEPLISVEVKSDNPTNFEKLISLQKDDNIVSKCITNTTDLIIVDSNNDIADILNVSPIINVDVKPQVPTTMNNTKRRKSKGDVGKVHPECANDYQLIAFGPDDTRVENNLSLFIKEKEFFTDDEAMITEKNIIMSTNSNKIKNINGESEIENEETLDDKKEGELKKILDRNEALSEDKRLEGIITTSPADIIEVINHTLNEVSIADAKINDDTDVSPNECENFKISEEGQLGDIAFATPAETIEVINHYLNEGRITGVKTNENADVSPTKCKNEISIKEKEEPTTNSNLNENSHHTDINIQGSNTKNMTNTDINSSCLHKGDVFNLHNSVTEQKMDVCRDNNMTECTRNVGDFVQENITCDDIPIKDCEASNSEDCVNLDVSHTLSSDLSENIECKRNVGDFVQENFTSDDIPIENCVNLNVSHTISDDLLENVANLDIKHTLTGNSLENTQDNGGINQNSVYITNLDSNSCEKNSNVENTICDDKPTIDFNNIPVISTEQTKNQSRVDLGDTTALSGDLLLNVQGNYDNCDVVTNLDDSNLCNSNNEDSNQIIVKEEVLTFEDENKVEMELQMEDLFEENSETQVIDQNSDLSHTKGKVLDLDQSSDKVITIENKDKIEIETVGPSPQAVSEIGKNIVIRRKGDQLISFDETDDYCDISIKETKNDTPNLDNNSEITNAFDILVPEIKPNEFTEKSTNSVKNIKSFDSFDILDDFASSPTLVQRNSSFLENDNTASDIDNDSFELYGYSSEILDIATSLIDDSNLLIVEESFTSIDNKTKNTLDSINDVSNLLDDSTLLIDDSADLLHDASALMDGTKSLISDSTASVDDLLASISQMKPSKDFTNNNPNLMVINEKDTIQTDVVLNNDQTDPSLISDITTLINNTSTLLSDFHSLSDDFVQTGVIESNTDINNVLDKQESDVTILKNVSTQKDELLKNNLNDDKNENILNVLDKKECLTKKESSIDKDPKDDKLLQNETVCTNEKQVSPFVELENPYDTLRTLKSEEVISTPCEELRNPLDITTNSSLNDDQPNMEIDLPKKESVHPNMEIDLSNKDLVYPNIEPETPFEIVENPYKEFETPNKDFHISYKLTTPNPSIKDNSTSISDTLTSVSDSTKLDSDSSSDSEEEKEGYQTVLDRFNALIGSRK